MISKIRSQRIKSNCLRLTVTALITAITCTSAVKIELELTIADKTMKMILMVRSGRRNMKELKLKCSMKKLMNK